MKKNSNKKRENTIASMVEHVQKMVIGNVSDQYHSSKVVDIIILIIVVVVIFIIEKLTGR